MNKGQEKYYCGEGLKPITSKLCILQILDLKFLGKMVIRETIKYPILWRCPWCSRYRRREMNTAIRVQILDETDCISHSTNTLGKGMNPIILPPAMGKQQDRPRFSSLGEATSLGEGKL